MRKFLLSLAAVFGIAGMSAAESTVLSVSDVAADPSIVTGTHYEKVVGDDGKTKTNERWQPVEKLVLGGYTFTFIYSDALNDKGNAMYTAPAVYGAATADKYTIRCYNTTEMTIAAPAGQKMGSIKMICDGLKADPKCTSEQGTVAYSAGNLTWTGTPVENVAIAFPATVKIFSFEISAEQGDEPVTPPAQEYATGTAEKPLTVAEFLAQGIPASAVADTYVKGFIVGNATGKDLKSGVIFTAEGASATNILIAASADEKEVANCIPVQLPSGTVRDALNLQANPSNLGKEVTLLGSHEKYFGVNGLKSVKEYAFSGSVIEPPVVEPSIYTGLVDNADGWTFDNVTLPEELTYVWQWKESNGKKYLNGSAYADDKPSAAEAFAISPVISLENYIDAEVSFDHAAKFQTNLRQDCKFLVREENTQDWAELEIPVWPTAGKWDFVNCGTIDLSSYLGKKIQFAFKYVSTAEHADTWEINHFVVKGEEKPNAIEGIESENAPAEYYDLNGRRVYGDLSNGIYIMRQGTKVSKVLVK